MSVKRLPTGKWRATVYIGGRQYTRHFDSKRAGEEWEVRERESVQRGAWIEPDKRKVTVAEWADRWLLAYGVNRSSTVRQAGVHLTRIKAAFGDMKLHEVSPTHVKVWVADLQREGLAPSTCYALHRRLAQLFGDAVHEGLVTRVPTSRRTSPKAGKQRPYVATTEQVWAIYDAMPAPMRPAVLLGAFAGLRIGEIVALTVQDVDYARGTIHPRVQYSDKDYEAPLKTETSATAVPVPAELMVHLAAVPDAYATEHLVVSVLGERITPARLDVHFRRAADSVPGLPAGFRMHDLRHYYASALIGAGLDIKTVQARVRHASAKVTLDVYGHLLPDRDDSTRDAMRGALRPAEAPPAAPAPVVTLSEARARRRA